MPLSPAHKGALLTALAMLLFAIMDSMSKLLTQDYPIVEALWVRYVIFLVFALIMARPRGMAAVAKSARPWMQTARSLVSLVEAGVFVLAFQYLPLAETHAVAASSPLMVVALSAPLLGERIGPGGWLSVCAAFAGVMLIIRPGFAALSWPLLIPLLGAFLWALYQIMVRFLAREDSPETTLLWSAFVGLIALSLAAPWDFRMPDSRGWLLLGVIGILGSFAHYAMIKALNHARASTVQPYGYLLLVFAAIMGWLVFGDTPDCWTVLGACIVVLSGLYTWSRERQGPGTDQETGNDGKHDDGR